MSRIDLVHLRLETTSPLSITAPEAADDDAAETDLPLVQDPDGNHLVPATTVAGSLRAHLAAHGHADLCGPPPPDDPGDAGATLTPSPVTVLGTRVSGPDGDRPGVGARTRTAVDRVRGSAREHMLFTQQGLDAGTLVDVWLLSEAPLDDALDALASWHPSLGRGTTSGAGRTRLVHLRHTSIDLATPEGRRTWLSGLGPDRVSALCTHEVPVAAPDTPADELRWTATIVDGLHVGTGHKQPETATPVQRLPDGTPYVPGTAIKGVFRSRVAYICDSLVDPPDAEHEVCTRDTVIPCPVCVLFGNTARRGLLHFADAPIADATVVEQPHVAIDRFTGGAHDGKLWTDEVVTAGTFPLVITSPRPLSTTHRRLLEHAAADLHDGYAAFGGRTGRGHGTVRLDPPPAPEPLGADELPRLRPLELPRDEP